jgi:toxin ParE1/3/4
MKVVITDRAKEDLRAIARWISRDHPQRAVSFVGELANKARLLGRFPKRYTVRFHRGPVAIRARVHGDYLIFYHIVPDSVEVLRILHGARDYAAILFPEAGD